jgi:hypothetical protein
MVVHKIGAPGGRLPLFPAGRQVSQLCVRWRRTVPGDPGVVPLTINIRRLGNNFIKFKKLYRPYIVI